MFGKSSYDKVNRSDDRITYDSNEVPNIILRNTDSFVDISSDNHSIRESYVIINRNEYDTFDEIVASEGDKLPETGDTSNHASWYSCYINLTSTIVGAGLLGMPFALSRAGWLLGTFLLVICGLLSGFGLHLITICALSTESPSSFYKVVEKALPGCSVLVDLSIVVKCFGIATSYLVVIGDSMPLAFAQFGAPVGLQDRNVCILLAFVVLGPLSALPTLDALRFTSSVSGIFILFIVLLFFLFSVHLPGLDPCFHFESTLQQTCRGDTTLTTLTLGTLRALPIYCFGFSCQQNTFSIVNELVEPSLARLDSVYLAAILSTTVLYLIIAYSGYSIFGDHLQVDIIKMFPQIPIVSASRLILSFIVACHYPLQMHPARRSILSILSKYRLNLSLAVEDTLKYAITTVCLLFILSDGKEGLTCLIMITARIPFRYSNNSSICERFRHCLCSGGSNGIHSRYLPFAWTLFLRYI